MRPNHPPLIPQPQVTPALLLTIDLPLQERLHKVFQRRCYQIFLRLQESVPPSSQNPATQIGLTANLWMRAQEMALAEISPANDPL
ncbi:MAG: hypothetical protein M0Z85_09385 [Gammaproteobacteria bacterium]|nr:hypothetical protein [Gammaproteobacteria bacterium]